MPPLSPRRWPSNDPRSPTGLTSPTDSQDAQASLLPDDATDSEKQSARNAQLTKSVLLCFLLTCMFSQYMLITFLSPFLPREIDKHDVSSSWVGVILASDALATCICSPIIGFLLTESRVRPCLILGLALVAVSGFSMSFIPDHFSGISIVPPFIGARLLQGLGGAMVETAAYGQLLNVFSDERGKVMALSETVIGLGVIAGPPFGGTMYQLGKGGEDFALPCIVFAAFPLVLLVLTPFCMSTNVDSTDGSTESNEGDNQDPERAAGPQFSSAVLSAPFMITLACVVLSSSALGFINPLLAPYLQDRYGVGSGLAGVFFMIPGLVYILTALATGALVDTYGDSDSPHQEYKLKRLGVVGFAVLIVSCLLIAPVFARTTLENMGVLSGALVLMGLGVGLTILPTISDLQSIAERKVGKDDMTLTSKVAGLWGSAFGAGAALGPVIGGFLGSAVGMNWGAFVFSTVCCLGLVLNACGAAAAVAAEGRRVQMLESAKNGNYEYKQPESIFSPPGCEQEQTSI